MIPGSQPAEGIRVLSQVASAKVRAVRSSIAVGGALQCQVNGQSMPLRD